MTSVGAALRPCQSSTFLKGVLGSVAIFSKDRTASVLSREKLHVSPESLILWARIVLPTNSHSTLKATVRSEGNGSHVSKSDSTDAASCQTEVDTLSRLSVLRFQCPTFRIT